MPVSRSKDFSEILYDHFPKLYQSEDAKANPEPYPLKRFMQVASLGYKKLENEIDGMQLLFNADFMDEKYLDPIGRMLGFDFPVGTTSEEKRKIIANLPMLYKLKGNDRVYEMLARLLFNKDAKTSTTWIRTETTTNVVVNLEVGDRQVEGIDEKMERFQELVEFFRPVNVGNSWSMLVVYDYLVELGLFKDEDEVNVMHIDDNFNTVRPKDVTVFNSPRLLGNNFMLYGGNVLPETYYMRNIDETTVDLLKYDPEDDNATLIGNDEDSTEKLLFTTITENVEVYPLDIGGEDVILDYRNMLNYGILGSTITLNELPSITRR